MQIFKITFVNLTLLFTMFINSCSKPKPNFLEHLFLLSDEKVEDRQAIFQSWINQNNSFPIVEKNRVYFIYQNTRDIPVYLSGDMNGWSPKADQMLRIIGTDYYYVEQNIPEDARVEYKFIVEKKYILDPLNEIIAIGGLGKNSLLQMPEYQFPMEVLLNRFQQYTKLDTVLFKKIGRAHV